MKAATKFAFQSTNEGQPATDFHNKGFLIQADDAAFYFFTLVVQHVNLEAFIEQVMGPMGVTSELGETQCHCHIYMPKREEGRPLAQNMSWIGSTQSGLFGEMCTACT